MRSARKDKFRIRFNKYYSLLCNIAYTYISDREECEDIVQDTFISIWDREKDDLQDDEFISYMVTSVKNNCKSFLRKKKIKYISIEDVNTFSNTTLTDKDGDLNNEIYFYESLKNALAILSPRCREIFIMCKQEGMKYREIANDLCISEKTVENHMGKAIKQLRAYIIENPFSLIISFLLFLKVTNI